MGLTSYDPVVVPMPSLTVDDSDVYARANEIVAQIPSYGEADDEVAQPDDRVKVCITMREEGLVMKGLDGIVITISLGDGFFPQPLIDGIVGMKEGQSCHVEWRAPSVGSGDEEGEMSSMDADVELLSLFKRVKPPMTDEWVRLHIPHCDNLDQFFSKIRLELEETNQKTLVNLKRQRVQMLLAQRLDESPSYEEISRAAEGVKGSFSKAAAQKGMTVEQFAAEQGLEVDQLDVFYAQQGALIAAAGKAVSDAADYFGIAVSDEEIDESIRRNFGGDESVVEECLKGSGRSKAERVARCEKMLDRFIDEAIEVDEGGFASDTQVPANPYPNPFA